MDEILRYTKGKHETEIYEMGRGESYGERYKKCEKSLGHDNYISVPEFTKEHLPAPYQDEDIARLVKVMANLTVEIVIGVTSKDRPKFYKWTSDSYPFSEGFVGIRTGTGRVEDVRLIPNNSSQNMSWEVKIFTATHVVYDDFEAKHAKCRSKYDSDSSVNHKDVYLKGIEVIEADVLGDWCCFKCETDNAALANELQESLNQCTEICKKLAERYHRMKDDKLTIIVGHPHGGPKKVSIGAFTTRKEINWPDETKYWYTTTTCAGSSGSWVYVLGRAASCRLSYHVHSGHNTEKGNYSSVGWDF